MMDLEEGTGTLDSDTKLLKEVQVIESTNINGACLESARYHLLMVFKFNLIMAFMALRPANQILSSFLDEFVFGWETGRGSSTPN